MSSARPDGEEKTAAPAKPPSLRGRDLRGAVLTGASFQRTDFSGAHLEGAILADADLQAAKLSCPSRLAMFGVEETARQKQREICAHLEGADLSFAQLRGADLWYAQLQGAALYGTRLQGADLGGNSIGRALLQGAFLRNAYLRGADLSGARLQGSDLSYAKLQGANLNGANLQGANLDNAQLEGADLSSAQLQGADLTGATLKGATLDEVTVWGTKTSDSELKGAWVRNIKVDPPSLDVYTKTINEILGTIPKGNPTGRLQNSTRAKAEERLKKNPLPTKGHDKFSAIWRDAEVHGKPAGFDQTVDDIWGTIGCDAEDAPYVMSRLISRLGNLESKDKDRAARLATQLLQDKNCEGRKGLSAADLASLKTISASTPPQEAGQAPQ